VIRRFGTAAMVALLVVAACAGDPASSPAITDSDAQGTTATPAPSTTTTVSAPTTERTAPTSTQPPPTTTTIADRTADLGVLRSDGLGSVDFGIPAEDALTSLIDLLGPPDGDTVSSEPECVLAIQQTRTVHWETIGLHVLFTDWPGSYDLPPAPLHFATWTLEPTSTPPTQLSTPDGIRIGSTAADVRSLPNSSPMIPDVNQWGFRITDGTGAVSGDFAWPVTLPYYFIDEPFAVELQQALNDHGATLAVDGIVGPATTQALIDFAAQRNIDGFSIEPAWDSIQLTPEVLEVFWLLELPPDDAPVRSMWTGYQSTCG
jgi:hypothetical protein